MTKSKLKINVFIDLSKLYPSNKVKYKIIKLTQNTRHKYNHIITELENNGYNVIYVDFDGILAYKNYKR